MVASLSLFNEQGEPNTSTNEIADEVDISPGNLHYHFRKKSELIDALLQEFKADARRVLDPPTAEHLSIDDFWVFLHLLLETTAAYRFLLRDMETLAAHYPKVRSTLKIFAKGLVAVTQLYLGGMRKSGALAIRTGDIEVTSRNIAVIALFSERLEALLDADMSADASALRIAQSVLSTLMPHTEAESADALIVLADQYR